MKPRAQTLLALARHNVGRTLRRVFDVPDHDIESGTVDTDTMEESVAAVLVDEWHPRTLRNRDTGAVIDLPVDLVAGPMLARAGGGDKARVITGMQVLDEAALRARVSDRKHADRISATCRGFGLDRPTLPKTLNPAGLKTVQGVVGTEFDSDVPAVEASDEYTPFKARGLGLDHGKFQTAARSTPALWDSIQQRKNFLTAARWEWTIPDEVAELAASAESGTTAAEHARAILASLGVDPELLRRQADELNVEFALNPNLDMHQVRSEMCLQGDQCGFAVHEFGIDPSAEAARRITFIELRNASSIDGWIQGPNQELLGFTQQAPSTGVGTRQQIPVVDIRKCLHFANSREGANFEGVSNVRPAMFWRRLAAEFSKASILHVQRFGRGIPVIRRPKEARQDATAIGKTRLAAKNYYNSRNSFFDAPEGFDIEVLQMQAQEGGLVAVLEYCDRMARTAFGAGVFDLGRDGTGSYALANVVSQLVLQSLRGFARGPERAHRRIATAYIDAVYGPQSVYPVHRITGILSRSPSEAISAWRGVVELERLAPKMSLEERNQLRQEAGLPSVVDEQSADLQQDTALADDAQRMRAGHVHGPGCVHQRAKVSVLCRGGEYVTHRVLTAPEQSVDFRALDDLIDTSKGDGLDAIRNVAIETRRLFIQAADPMIEAGDIAGLSTLEIDTVAETTVALRSFYERIADRVAEDMIAELSALTGGEFTAEMQAAAGPGIDATVEAMANATARNVVRQFNARLRAAAIAVAQGGRRSQLTRLLPSETFAGGEIQGGTLTVLGETREQTAMTAGPLIKRVQYSAVMDQNTCDECSAVDENEYVAGSASWEQVRPPNRNCDGEKSGQPRCRCIGVYIPG